MRRDDDLAPVLVATLLLLLVAGAVGGLHAAYVYGDWTCAISNCVKVIP